MLDLQVWILILLVYGLIILFDVMENKGAMDQLEAGGAMSQVGHQETERKLYFKLYWMTMSVRFLSYALLSFLTLASINQFEMRVICFLVSYTVSYILSSFIANKYRKHLCNKLIAKEMSDIAKSKQ